MDLQVDEDTNRLLRDYSQYKESNLYQAAMDLIIRANWKMMEELRADVPEIWSLML